MLMNLLPRHRCQCMVENCDSRPLGHNSARGTNLVTNLRLRRKMESYVIGEIGKSRCTTQHVIPSSIIVADSASLVPHAGQ